MVAVVGEEIIAGPLELLRGFANDLIDFGFGKKGEALENFAFECPARWLQFWPCVIYTAHSTPVVSAVCIFLAIYDDARVK